MRNRKNYRSRIRKEARTIPLYGNPDRGNGLDDGRYYRCWNCGFICNIDRDKLGGHGDGISYEDFPVPFDASLNSVSRLGGSIGPSAISPKTRAGGSTLRGGGFLGRICMMVGISFWTTLAIGPLLDSVMTDKHHIMPIVDAGCPFCGTLNWKR